MNESFIKVSTYREKTQRNRHGHDPEQTGSPEIWGAVTFSHDEDDQWITTD